MKNINNTNIVDIFKALSNETRLNILQWLKDPEHCFLRREPICRKESRLPIAPA